MERLRSATLGTILVLATLSIGCADSAAEATSNELHVPAARTAEGPAETDAQAMPADGPTASAFEADAPLEERVGTRTTGRARSGHLDDPYAPDEWFEDPSNRDPWE